MSKKTDLSEFPIHPDVNQAPVIPPEEAPAEKDAAPCKQQFTAATLPKVADRIKASQGIYMLGHVLKCALTLQAKSLTSSFDMAYNFDEEKQEHIFSLFVKKHMPGQHKWDRDMRAAMREEAKDRLSGFLEELDMRADDDRISIDSQNFEIFFSQKIDLYKLVAQYLQENKNTIIDIGHFSLTPCEPIHEFGNAVPDAVQTTKEFLRTKNNLADKLVSKNAELADDFLIGAFNKPFLNLTDYKAHVAVVHETLGTDVMLFGTVMALAEERIKLEEGLDRTYGFDLERDTAVLRPTLN